MRDDPLIALIIVIAPLSLLAIGGASAIYAPLQHQTVEVYRWVTGREFVELFAIARVTPGPGSMLTTLIGWKVAGFAGALVATLALYIPVLGAVLRGGADLEPLSRHRLAHRARGRAASDRRRAHDRRRGGDPAHRGLRAQRLDAHVAEAGLAHPADAVRAGEVEAAGAREQHLQTCE